MTFLKRHLGSAATALFAIYGSSAIAAEIVSQKPILLEISVRGQATSQADKITFAVMVVTDQKSGRQ